MFQNNESHQLYPIVEHPWTYFVLNFYKPDVPDCVNSLCSIFADDTKAYNSTDKFEMLQEDIHALKKWSHKWQLYFNCSKYKCFHLGRNNPCIEYVFKADDGDEEIPTRTEEKYLGSYLITL